MCYPFSWILKKNSYCNITTPRKIKTNYFYDNTQPKFTPIIPKKCIYCNSIMFEKTSNDIKWHRDCKITHDIKKLFQNNKTKSL